MDAIKTVMKAALSAARNPRAVIDAVADWLDDKDAFADEGEGGRDTAGPSQP